jgi:YbgC/YbaW family acyl-CoA thioester hydrolase
VVFDDTAPVLQELELRLSYADCDPAGIVYYAAYYPWFERVYSEWTHANGISGERAHELWGARLITVASSCDYLVPGRLHDLFDVRMRLRKLGRSSFTMGFGVEERGTRQTFARGTMTLVFVDRPDLDADAKLEAVPVPDGWRDALRLQGYPI